MLLGNLNVVAMDRYRVQASDLALQQAYLDEFIKQLATGRAQAGVISGCVVTPLSGLTVQISAGLVLFPSGQLCWVAAQNIALSTADPSDPRIDRLELAYSFANSGSTVTNIDGGSVVRDKQHTATLSKLTGTAAASPSAPAKTAANVSLGLVTVTAGMVTVLSGSIDQTEDTARDISALSFSDGTSRMRFNSTKGYFEVSEDGSTWKAIRLHEVSPISFTISNNVAATSISGLVFDKTKVRGAKFKLLAYRKDGTPTESVEVFECVATYKDVADSWTLTANSSQDDSGVTLTITSAGQVQYATTNYGGGSYVGKGRVTDVVTFAL